MDKFYIASVFGPLLIIVGLWSLCCVSQAKKVLESVRATPAIFYLGGVINLLFGLMIVNVYNKWMWDWSLLVTLFGWLLIVRGAFVLLFPEKMLKVFGDHSGTRTVAAIIGIAWGIGLTILAFG